MGLFSDRLRECQQKGQLTVGDLHWFLRRHYRTVKEWAVNDRSPEGPRSAEMWKALDRIDALLQTGVLPVPMELSKRQRSEFMRLLGEGRLGRAKILASRAAAQRRVRGVRAERRVTPAVGMRHDRAAK